MKALIFYNTAWYIYNFRKNLIQEMQQRGCEVIAVSPIDPWVEKLEELGVKHRAIGMKPRKVNPLIELTVVLQLWRILREIRPDYVLSYTIKCNLYAGLCRYLIRFRQIANVSGLGEVFEKRGFLNQIVCMLYRFSLRKAHCIFFQNREDLEFCAKRRLVPRSVARLLPGSGVDLSRFRPTTEAAQRNGAKVFLILGRLLPKKGFDEFIAAARHVRADFGGEAQFWILGMRDNNRPESHALYRRIREAERHGWIRYLSQTDNVVPVIREADVVVLPSSYNEGIPRSLLEGMACGKAIITTDWKGCRETVEPGRNGFTVPVGNVQALASSMRRMIEMPAEQFHKMGRYSREMVERRFDEQIVIGLYASEMRLQPRRNEKESSEDVAVATAQVA